MLYKSFFIQAWGHGYEICENYSKFTEPLTSLRISLCKFNLVLPRNCMACEFIKAVYDN